MPILNTDDDHLRYPRTEEPDMTRRIEEVEREALELPANERARLAERLMASLAVDRAPGVEAAWVEEALRRDREMSEGTVEGIPADEVFRELRARRE